MPVNLRNELKILFVEDSEDDAILEIHQVQKGGYSVYYERVDNASDMAAALNEKKWDIVLSDYSMPHFNGLDALALLKNSGIDIPFIIISGIIGEEVAVEAMKAGANDYVMKSNLKRLVPAIERELKEAQNRIERLQFEQKNVQVEESLRESEERYRLIADNTADTISIWDMDFNLIYISPSVQKLRGYSVQESLSHSLDHFLSPESVDKVKNIIRELISLPANDGKESSKPSLFELEQIHKNGSIIQVEVSVSFIRDKDSSPINILAVTRDITLRKHFEERLKVLSHAIEQSPAMIVITNTDGNIEYANPEFERVTGYSLSEVIGKNPNILKSGNNTDQLYKELWETITAGDVWHGELINKKKNGDLYWANVSASPIFSDDGIIKHFSGIQQDITAKKMIEEELIVAKERAEESDRLKSSFLQNMSHEIRTPMNAIVGFSELLINEIKCEGLPKKYGNIIESSCADLLNIINGILEIAQIESGQTSVCYEDCNVNKLFSELTLLYNNSELQLGKQHIEFTMKPTPETPDIIIKTDSSKLKQIFTNLINNAFKFTEKGLIQGGCYFDENHKITFYVSDTGIGIPEDKQGSIFQRFVKLNQDKNRFIEGTGIGLAIVKEILNLLGGNIWLESVPGNGTTFYFTLN